MVVDCWVVADDVDKRIKVHRRRGHGLGIVDFHFGRLCLCPHPLIAMSEKEDFTTTQNIRQCNLALLCIRRLQLDGRARDELRQMVILSDHHRYSACFTLCIKMPVTPGEIEAAERSAINFTHIKVEDN